MTLTPRGPNSAAQVRVSCASAALVAEYIAANGTPTFAIHEPMVMIAPLPRSAIAGAERADRDVRGTDIDGADSRDRRNTSDW